MISKREFFEICPNATEESWKAFCIQLSDIMPRTVGHQAPLSRGFPRQECWSGLPFPSPGHLPDPGIELTSALADRFFTTEPPGFISMIGEIIGHQ